MNLGCWRVLISEQESKRAREQESKRARGGKFPDLGVMLIRPQSGKVWKSMAW